MPEWKYDSSLVPSLERFSWTASGMVPDSNGEFVRGDGVIALLGVHEQILLDLNRVIDAIPECPAHGERCIAHAVEWVGKVIADAD